MKKYEISINISDEWLDYYEWEREYVWPLAKKFMADVQSHIIELNANRYFINIDEEDIKYNYFKCINNGTYGYINIELETDIEDIEEIKRRVTYIVDFSDEYRNNYVMTLSILEYINTSSPSFVTGEFRYINEIIDNT